MAWPGKGAVPDRQSTTANLLQSKQPAHAGRSLGFCHEFRVRRTLAQAATNVR